MAHSRCFWMFFLTKFIQIHRFGSPLTFHGWFFRSFPLRFLRSAPTRPLSSLFRFAGGGARETGDADTAPLFLGSRARDRERAKNFFIDRHSLSFFLFCDFFSFLFSVVWFGLVWFCSVVEMGLMSRKVLPVCGNMCVCCPALRARSRQPVKRYNMLLAEIYPKNQV